MTQEERKDAVLLNVQTESKKQGHPGMVFKVAGERARELSEWSKKSFESKKPFGQASPRF